ncbi:MAG: Hsp20/alpha crystallin family protein [Caldilineaceae bacterium]|nr:Hsp20/alpha crystallin family protein [Caldilineaceae bacterium]
MAAKTYNTMVRDFVSMADAMNRMLDVRPYDYTRNGGHNGEDAPKRVMRLPVDAWVGEEAFTLQAFLPGVNPEDVEITFEGEELAVRGHFPQAAEDLDFLKRELYHGDFERRLTFNVPVDADKIEATFENGVLTLVVPKAEAIRPKQIKIQAK